MRASIPNKTYLADAGFFLPPPCQNASYLGWSSNTKWDVKASNGLICKFYKLYSLLNEQ